MARLARQFAYGSFQEMTNHPRQPISIVGGGLSGLALGILLARHGIQVELFESHPYPHHRVCGEFISGLNPALVADLGITDLLDDAHRHDQTTWHAQDGTTFHRFRLHQPAYGISRYRLDARLARRFRESGGNLIQHRWRDYERHEKVIYTTGRSHTRQKIKPKWIGLKLHARGFNSDSHLEMHLGRGGYVGASSVEDGITNLCGLFPATAWQSSRSVSNFESALDAIALHTLRRRLDSCEIIPGTRCGTLHFQPGYQTPIKSKCCIGDSMLQIPPFTGHGMSMAFEAAWIAHAPLLDYVQGGIDWKTAVLQIRRSLSTRHSLRVQLACLLHPVMLRGRLPQYWKWFGALLGPLTPRVSPVLWGEAPRLRIS
ncbi:MAG: NAD(P)-binding protein [Verrucomicrobiota bacterium]